MLYMAYRYHRPTFWAILPFILTFYAATVYGRYHYLSDTVTGIALGLVVAWAATRAETWWERKTMGGQDAASLATDNRQPATS